MHDGKMAATADFSFEFPWSQETWKTGIESILL